MAVQPKNTGAHMIAFNQSVKKGKWYLGLVCKGCAKPMLIFEDRSKGAILPDLSGMGTLMRPCENCKSAYTYEHWELKQYRATKDIPSYRDKRPKPTNTRKEKLLPKYKGQVIAFGAGAIEQIPEINSVMARIVTYWTLVETSLARLLSVVLKANSEPAIAVYLSLKNARAKNEALEAAAELTLSSEDFELFQAIIRWKNSLEKERNDIAHGIFGYSFNMKDGLIWISTQTYADHLANVEAFGLTEKADKSYHENMYVYKILTLERIAQEIENLELQIVFFLGYIRTSDAVFRALRYPQLCSEPHVQKELNHLRQHPKNTQ